MSGVSTAAAVPRSTKRPSPPATSGRGGNRYLTRDEIIAIYLASGLRKNIAADFEVTESTVCHIKLGHRHLDITAPYRLAAKVNATLVSMACGVSR